MHVSCNHFDFNLKSKSIYFGDLDFDLVYVYAQHRQTIINHNLWLSNLFAKFVVDVIFSLSINIYMLWFNV